MICCDMKGFLSYLILWVLSKEKLKGSEISKELARRKGSKPSPGTIYPALKNLKEHGLITSDENKVYSITKKGEKELTQACHSFHQMFYDMRKMCDYEHH